MNAMSFDPILPQLFELQQKPAPFTPGEPLFWNDPHISSQMLKFHLDPNVEAASRQLSRLRPLWEIRRASPGSLLSLRRLRLSSAFAYRTTHLKPKLRKAPICYTWLR